MELAVRNNTEEGANEHGDVKLHQDDCQVDSGFLSGGQNSDLSIDSEGEERSEESSVIKVAPEPLKAIDSGLNLGLGELCLKDQTNDSVDARIINPNSEELELEVVKQEENEEEDTQEPWELYYSQNDQGDTQLHISIIKEFLEAAFYLISIAPHPCLLNILNDDSEAALHLAVLIQQPRLVRRLVLAGANLNIRNFRGNTPLHLACMSGDIYCVKALTNQFTPGERTWLESGRKVPILPQNLQQRNYNGEMCLHIAAAKGHVEVVQHLLSLGADINAREGLSGRTALHLAIEAHHREVVRILLNEGQPHLDMCNYGGLTAYHLAQELDHQLAMELTRCGATPSLSPILDSDSDSDEDEDEEKEGEDSENSLFPQMILRDLGFGLNPLSAVA